MFVERPFTGKTNSLHKIIVGDSSIPAPVGVLDGKTGKMLHCPNPHCENSMIRGTGVECPVCKRIILR